MSDPVDSAVEAARLASLAGTGLLDSAPEAAFDDLTTLVSQLLKVPVALVSLVDADRQWFKSRVGVSVASTPRAISFCTHVVAQGAAVEIPDARLDPRFADNPLVTDDPHVRAYLGQPVRSPEGLVLGTLCAIDQVPRTFTQPERDLLALLARQVSDQIETRRQTRVLAREREELADHRRLIELTSDLVCTLGPDMHLRLVSPAWTRVLGWSLEELRAQPITAFIHPDDVEPTRTGSQRMFAETLKTPHFENRYRTRDGDWVPLAWTARVADGVMYATARDLRPLRRHEAEVRARDARIAENESRLRAFFDSMAEGVMLHDADGAIVSCNAAAERILGVPQEQVRGKPTGDPRWPTIQRDGSAFPVDAYPARVTLTTGQPCRDVWMGMHRPTGDLVWLSLNTQPLIRDGETVPYGVVTTFRDITTEVAARAALEDERRFLASVLARIPNATVVLFSRELTVLEVFGPPLGGTSSTLTDWAAGPQREGFLGAARRCLEGMPARTDLAREGRKYDVTFVPFVDSRGAVAHGLALAYDVSERDALRDSLARHERLVTVGTLAAGVGHEINNPLSYVLSNLEFALETLKVPDALWDPAVATDLVVLLRECQVGAQTISDIVRDLRAFSREGTGTDTMNLTEVVELAVSMARSPLKSVAAVTVDPRATRRVVGDGARLVQVLVNILVNAGQAFPCPDPTAWWVRVVTADRPDGRVEVSVTDNGPGIDPAVLPRVFDPYFTTRPMGQGRGLGLSMAHSIVATLGGELACESTVGKGTTFRVVLPGVSPAV